MHQVALERARRHREQHFLVHQVVAPARVHAVEEARAPVGVALAVREPAAEEAVAPRHAVHRRDRRGERRLDRLRELGRDALVGVEAQHPVVARLLDRELLLAAEAEPFLLHHARALARRELGVPSVEPESTITISSANARLSRQGSSTAAALRVMRTAESGFTGGGFNMIQF